MSRRLQAGCEQILYHQQRFGSVVSKVLSRLLMRKIFFISTFIKIKPVKLRADLSFFSFYVYGCFACVYVCVPVAYLTCRAQKGCQIPGAVPEGWEPPNLEGFGHSALVHVSISNIYVLFAVGRFLRSFGILFQNRANKGSQAIWDFAPSFLPFRVLLVLAGFTVSWKFSN